MKSILLLFLLVASALGQTNPTSPVTLSWDANTEPDLAGYRLYESATGTNSSTFTVAAPTIGMATTYTHNLVVGPHWMALTAYNTSGMESLFSDIVFVRIPSVVQNLTWGYDKVSKLISLSWSPNPAAEGATNYAVYEQGTPNRLIGLTAASNLWITPEVGQHTFYVLAKHPTGGASPKSGTVGYTGMSKPKKFLLVQ